MVSIRFWQIKTGKVTINENEPSFWKKTYEAILVGEDKAIRFLLKIFSFCGDKFSKLGIGEKMRIFLNRIFGKINGKIGDIRKAVKGETVLGEKENASGFLKDISSHKESSKNNGEPLDVSIEKQADK